MHPIYGTNSVCIPFYVRIFINIFRLDCNQIKILHVAIKNALLCSFCVILYNTYVCIMMSLYLTGILQQYIWLQCLMKNIETILISLEIICVFLTLDYMSNIYMKWCKNCNNCCNFMMIKSVNHKLKKESKRSASNDKKLGLIIHTQPRLSVQFQ